MVSHIVSVQSIGAYFTHRVRPGIVPVLVTFGEGDKASDDLVYAANKLSVELLHKAN